MTETSAATLVQAFYSAFSRRDAAAMAECYHPDVQFTDPVFGTLDHRGVTAMWRMLTEAGKDLRIAADSIEAGPGGARARWTAVYTYRPSPKKANTVTNRVSASFEFKDGLIVRHVDDFDFKAWISMAFAPSGRILALLPPFRALVRKKARRRLEDFMAAKRGS